MWLIVCLLFLVRMYIDVRSIPNFLKDPCKLSQVLIYEDEFYKDGDFHSEMAFVSDIAHRSDKYNN